jgi:hypothetical protein
MRVAGASENHLPFDKLRTSGMRVLILNLKSVRPEPVEGAKNGFPDQH